MHAERVLELELEEGKELQRDRIMSQSINMSVGLYCFLIQL